MDPKMDSGCLAPGETLDEDYDVTRPLLPQEVIGIIDQLLCLEVSPLAVVSLYKGILLTCWQMAWHLGYPLAQTLLTNVYIDRMLEPMPTTIQEADFIRSKDALAEKSPMHAVLRAYCLGLLKASWYVNERIKDEHYYEVTNSPGFAFIYVDTYNIVGRGLCDEYLPPFASGRYRQRGHQRCDTRCSCSCPPDGTPADAGDSSGSRLPPGAEICFPQGHSARRAAEQPRVVKDAVDPDEAHHGAHQPVALARHTCARGLQHQATAPAREYDATAAHRVAELRGRIQELPEALPRRNRGDGRAQLCRLAEYSGEH